MQEPAPTSAARDDTPTTSFGRMQTVPLFPQEATGYGPQNVAKNTTALRPVCRQIAGLIFD